MSARRDRGRRDGAVPVDIEDELFDDAPCGYILTDRTGLITAANAEFCRLVALDRDAIVGQRTLASLLPVGGRIYLETHLLPMIAHDGSVREVSLDLLRPDGTRVPVLLNADARDTPAGSGLALRGVLIETRDRHRYEQDLLAATVAAEQARLEATTLAHTLQQTLIPPAPPEIPHLEVGATYRPAGDGTTVGGDFFDFFQLDDATWMVVLGDVSGKGVEAAVVTSFVRYTVRALAMEHVADQVEALRHLDRALHAHPTTHYCTLVLAGLTWLGDRWRIGVSLAGHPPALLRRPDGQVAELGRYGSPVGLVARPTFHTVEHDLAEETIVLYTDGVTEARRDERLFGDHRLGELIASLPPDPTELIEGIADAVLAYQHGDASDDIAIVAFRAVP